MIFYGPNTQWIDCAADWNHAVRILIVEDELQLRLAIVRYFRNLGHAVDECDSFRQARAAVEVYEHDVVVLDRRLPDGDTLSLLQDWRDRGLQFPVIFLTALDSIDDRVDGLSIGADDYLVKPFSMKELSARISAITRRKVDPIPNSVMVGDLEFDRAKREVKRDGVVIPLRPKEYTLLELLIGNMGQLVTKQRIIETCWDESGEPLSNVEEALIASLRRKLGKPSPIRTIRGGGYIFEECK